MPRARAVQPVVVRRRRRRRRVPLLCGIAAACRIRFADRGSDMSPSMRWMMILALALVAQASPVAAAERMRGVTVTEERIALVIGNAAYRTDPLDNPVNDARLIAQSLKKSGFTVALQENLDRRGLVNALRDFG